MGWISNTYQAVQWSQLLHRNGNRSILIGRRVKGLPVDNTIDPKPVAIVFDGDGWVEYDFDYCQLMYEQGVFIYHDCQVVNNIRYFKYELPRPNYTPKHRRVNLT